jgi:peroxiredoxin
MQASGGDYSIAAKPCYRLPMTLEVGQPAPAFSLRNKKREEVTLDSYPGKRLVLAFYPIAFTGG